MGGNIPKQRGPGQRGGGGRIGQTSNRNASSNRGGRPHAGGGGGGSKNGCAVTALALAGGVIGALGYGAVELVKAAI